MKLYIWPPAPRRKPMSALACDAAFKRIVLPISKRRAGIKMVQYYQFILNDKAPYITEVEVWTYILDLSGDKVKEYKINDRVWTVDEFYKRYKVPNRCT